MARICICFCIWIWIWNCFWICICVCVCNTNFVFVFVCVFWMCTTFSWCQIKRGPSNKAGPSDGRYFVWLCTHTPSSWKGARKTFARRKSLILSSTTRILSSTTRRRQQQHLKWYSCPSHAPTMHIHTPSLQQDLCRRTSRTLVGPRILQKDQERSPSARLRRA